MDQIAPELLMALAGGTAGAAGEQIWTSLRDLVRRRHSGGEPGDQSELTALAEAPGNAERATELAEVLARRARQDPAFAQALAAWRREAEALEGTRTGSGDVRNVVSGGTQTTVIQARDVHGSINLGG
ncbi:hypothetical protein AV521_36665 [Streptomyces sp. IMTB 2501]|uniref:hypothetical protein n=1 Tax=Streptomyces sp. IMTB 2501 TaxID=1776340 RepID=UPI00096FEE47|nr:hypothetical protein [Streptomyces sp. IMTB 2501]OLZ64072.1 hypothetical protein AV521_36665 [Streptomyces sp. IMTB 2501]